MLLTRGFFFLRPTMSIACLNPQKIISFKKKNCIFDPCSKSKNYVPNSHPSHTKKQKLANINLIPPFFALIQKKMGVGGGGGAESRENNGCGVNEWPFLLKNQKIVTCSIGLMYELANFVMCLTFTITITKCFFSKDPNDYIVDNLFHQ